MRVTYAYLFDLSRDNGLMSGVRQKERFSLGALYLRGDAGYIALS
jgi:hypothetical protein